MSKNNINIIKVVQYIRATGEIIMSGTTCSTEGMESDDIGIITDTSADVHNQYVLDGVVMDKPPQPSNLHRFDYTTKSWQIDIEAARNSLRAKRDYLLAASDWTQLPDVPSETKDKWALYRQALRDVPAQEGAPIAVVWPIKPT